MNICIIGAGNIGTYLAADISMKDNCKVWLHTSKPELFRNEIILIEDEKNLRHKVKLHCITDNIKEAVEDADYILITYPSFLIENVLKDISKFIKVGAVIGAIPGFGGKEYLTDELIENGGIFFGTQRVPSIVRLESYGESVCLKQRNKFMKIRAIPGKHTNEVCKMMTNLIDIQCLPLNSYLAITLSPSNPTMHPSRLYELFKGYVKEKTVYDRNPYFYEEWGNEASSDLMKLDEELEEIFKALNEFNDFNKEDFEKIKIRFNTEKPEVVTEKIRNAPGFQGIDSPMIKCDNGYIPDVNSRYFTEDIQFGLCIIKAFAELCNIKTPTVDKIVVWGQNLLNKQYIVDGKLSGKDIDELIIPQTKGINDKQSLINYYKNL